MMPPTYSCTTCRAPLPQGSDRCARCGTLHSEHRRCESCGARAEVVRRENGIIYTCAACGKPRVPMERPGVMKSGREKTPLFYVGQARRDATVAQVGGMIGLGFGVGITLLSLFFFLFSTTLGIFFLSFAVIAALLGLYGLRVSRKNRKKAELHMKEAFGSVALDVMRSQGMVSSKMLADQMGIPEDTAEMALANVPEQPGLRVETVVDEKATDGLLRYRLAQDEAMPGEDPAMAEQRAFDAKLAAAMRAKQQGG